MPPRKVQFVEPSQQPFSSGFELPPPPPSTPQSSGINAGVLAGVCASVAVVLVLVAVVVGFVWRHRARAPWKASKASTGDQDVSSNTATWFPLCLPVHVHAFPRPANQEVRWQVATGYPL
jgi:heme/copper-type cytochrome/quinol oxidase subunit 2